MESTLDSEEDGSPRHAKMSRGLSRNASDSSDMSLDGPVIEASCGNRRIGEEWQSNGTTFRVGQDGRRQRQVLLRRRRSRFSMVSDDRLNVVVPLIRLKSTQPQDSQHPDSQAQLEVLVETWLNDEEFAAAEERGDLYNPTSDTVAIIVCFSVCLTNVTHLFFRILIRPQRRESNYSGALLKRLHWPRCLSIARQPALSSMAIRSINPQVAVEGAYRLCLTRERLLWLPPVFVTPSHTRNGRNRTWKQRRWLNCDRNWRKRRNRSPLS